MKIIEVGVKNVNGITGSLALTGKDVILGPNGAGKSTYLKALGLAFRGKDPDHRIGAQPISIRRLASGEEMTVSLAAEENGRKFGLSRTFREKGGSGEQEITVTPSRDEKTQAAMKARIAEELGDFPVIFDWEGEYGGLSDDKKRDYIFQLCAGETRIERDNLKSRIEAGICLDVEEENAETFRKWAGECLADWDDGQPFMVNFNRVLSFLAATEKDLRKQHKEAQAAAKRLVELKNSQPENLTQFNAREIRDKIEKYETERRRLDREIAVAGERIKAIDGREKQIADLTAQIQALPGMAAGQKQELEEIPGKIKELRNQLQAIQGKKGAVGNCPVGKWDCEDLLAQRDKIEAENARLEQEYDAGAEKIKTLESRKTELAILAEQGRQRDFLSAELRKLQQVDSGPIGDIDQMRQQVAGIDANLSKLREELQEKEKAKLAWEQAEQAALSRETLEIDIKAVKALRTIIGPRGIQGELVKGIMRPLAKNIQELMVGDDAFDFRMTDENGKEVFELGFSRGGHFIAVPSGGEEILFRSALLAALVAQKAPKCKLLIFELAECDREHGYRLLEALGKFVEQGKLDNVLVASCHDMLIPAGFRAHVLKPGAAAEVTDIAEPMIVGIDGELRETEIVCPPAGEVELLADNAGVSASTQAELGI